MTRSPPPALLELLEKSVRDILRSKDTKPADRLKAIEQGARLLAIRHKIEEGGGGGSFFGNR